MTAAYEAWLTALQSQSPDEVAPLQKAMGDAYSAVTSAQTTLITNMEEGTNSLYSHWPEHDIELQNVGNRVLAPGHGLSAGQRVTFAPFTAGTPPVAYDTGIVPNSSASNTPPNHPYYLVEVQADSFQLALTANGAPIDFTEVWHEADAELANTGNRIIRAGHGLTAGTPVTVGTFDAGRDEPTGTVDEEAASRMNSAASAVTSKLSDMLTALEWWEGSGIAGHR